MKAHTDYLTLNLPTKRGFLNITSQVQEAIRKSGVMEGLFLCSTMFRCDYLRPVDSLIRF